MSACPFVLASRLVEFASRIDEVRASDRGDMEQAVCEIRGFLHKFATGIRLDLQPRDPVVNLEAAIQMLQTNTFVEQDQQAVTLGNLESCVDEMFRGLEASGRPHDARPPLTSWFC